MRKFTDTASGGVVSVTAMLEIPVCEQCWKAPRQWWNAAGILFVLSIGFGVPVAISQEKHTDLPGVVPIMSLLLMVGSAICIVVARRHAPVRLVPTKIDRENVRITFFNQTYTDRFFEANKDTAKVINPWKFS